MKFKQYKLNKDFLEEYKEREVSWGFGGLGEVAFYRCVTVDTPVLGLDFTWKPAGSLQEGDKIIGFDEELKDGKINRYLREAEVTHSEIQSANVMGIELENGEILYATPEHRWLAKRNQQFEWIRTDKLGYNPNGGTTILPKWSEVWEGDDSFESGYLGAAFDGEASLDKACGLKFVQADNTMLEKVNQYLIDKNYKVTFSKKKNYNNDLSKKQTYSISLYGREQIQKFFGQTKSHRLMNKYIQYINSGDTVALRTPKENYNKVVRVFDAGKKEVAVMSTSTKTHITAGYPSHNTYSRTKEDGSKEEWWEVVQRVVEAIMSVYNGRMNGYDIDELARGMYDAIFNFKLMPSGRALWSLGTPIIKEKGLVEAIASCAFISTEDMVDSDPFEFMMDLSMLGVGLGFDVKGAGNLKVKNPIHKEEVFVIPDTREGWVDSTRILLDAFLKGEELPPFDYSKIRPEGEPIKTFGGIAPGPDPLIELHNSLTEMYYDKVGEDFDGRTIVDTFTMIGKAVVSGNVRRCLPKGTIVHTKDGLEKIEDVEVGSLVRTQGGYKKVLESIYQGKQNTVIINTEIGEVESTPDHRWKVFNGLDSFEWKEAQNLKENDRLVFVKDFEVEGIDIQLPSWEYDYPDHSTTCQPISVPELDKDSSWFFGMFHGGGYVYPNFEEDGFNAYVSVACSPDYNSITSKVIEQIERFGVDVNIVEPRDSDRSTKVRAQSKQLAYYLSQFKKAKETISVPEFVFKGTKEIRASYVAGLMDADGCYDKPWKITSVYEEYLKEVQIVLSSLGIASYVRLKRKSSGSWKDLYELYIKGSYHRKKFYDVVGKYSLKAPMGYEYKKSQRDYSYPGEFVRGIRGFSNHWYGVGDSMTENHYDNFVEAGLVSDNHATPIKVISVVGGEEKETYDLSVEGNHEFVIDKGLLSHNTALLALLPEELADLKDYEKYPERQSHGWLANHSVYGSEITNYDAIADNAMKNGEPGIVWVNKAQEYGRFADGKSENKDKATGVNACSEMNLENKEYCLLSEVVLSRINSLKEFNNTAKLAYLFGKAITEYLVFSRWDESSEVQRRNRRMGISLGGVAEFLGNRSMEDLISWCDIAYTNMKLLDKEISKALDINESIKITTVKPSGTTSLLSGSSPGAHLVKSRYMIKRMRVSNNKDRLIEKLKESGVPNEPAVVENNATVFSFAYNFDDNALSYENSEDPITLQVDIVENLQKWWADNSISVTVVVPESVNKEKIIDIIKNRQLKTISFLPQVTDYYPQMPLENVDKGEFVIKEVDLDYSLGDDAEGEEFCEDDYCQLNRL